MLASVTVLLWFKLRMVLGWNSTWGSGDQDSSVPTTRRKVTSGAEETILQTLLLLTPRKPLPPPGPPAFLLLGNKSTPKMCKCLLSSRLQPSSCFRMTGGLLPCRPLTAVGSSFCGWGWAGRTGKAGGRAVFTPEFGSSNVFLARHLAAQPRGEEWASLAPVTLLLC